MKTGFQLLLQELIRYLVCFLNYLVYICYDCGIKVLSQILHDYLNSAFDYLAFLYLHRFYYPRILHGKPCRAYDKTNVRCNRYSRYYRRALCNIHKEQKRRECEEYHMIRPAIDSVHYKLCNLVRQEQLTWEECETAFNIVMKLQEIVMTEVTKRKRFVDIFDLPLDECHSEFIYLLEDFSSYQYTYVRDSATGEYHVQRIQPFQDWKTILTQYYIRMHMTNPLYSRVKPSSRLDISLRNTEVSNSNASDFPADRDSGDQDSWCVNDDIPIVNTIDNADDDVWARI